MLPLLPADVTEHIRMDAETDVGHVVDVLATHKPDNLADLAFGIIAGHPGKSLGVNLFVPCQLGGIVPVRDTIERHMPGGFSLATSETESWGGKE